MEFGRAYSPFRALSVAWQLMRRAPATLFLGGLILFLFNGSAGSGISVSLSRGEIARLDPVWWVLIGVVALGGLVVAAALWVFDCWVRVGYARAVERVLSRGEEQIGDLVRAEGLWVPMMVTRLVVYAIDLCVLLPGVGFAALAWHFGDSIIGATLGWVLCASVAAAYSLVFAYVGLGVCLAGRAVAIEGLQPPAALKRSWDLVRGHRLRLGTYYSVLWVVGVLGIFLCCIGVVFTATLASVAHNESYLRLVRSAQDQSGWWCDAGSAAGAAEEPAPAAGAPEAEAQPPIPPPNPPAETTD
jgi:hypothetical protein